MQLKPKLHGTFKLKNNADIVEFAPRSIQSAPELAVCGCYEFDSLTNKRIGGVSLFQIEDNRFVNIPKVDNNCAVLNSSADFGVLDIKWCNSEKFICACSDSCLRVYETSEVNESISGTINLTYRETSSLIVSESIEIILSLDFSDGKIISSTDKGQLYLTDIESGLCEVSGKHESEIWTCVFSQHDSRIVFSGADDCFLNAWDTRTHKKVAKFPHTAGVCCVQTDKRLENYVLTGCYDDKIHVFDMRFLPDLNQSLLRNTNCEWRTLKTLEIKGGPWRIKFNPEDPQLVGVAAMYEGYKLIENLSEVGEKFSNPEETELLGYGFDWSRKDSNKFMTCSFYDKIVSLWKIQKF